MENQNRSVFSAISQHKQLLTRVEAQIAEFIMENPESILSMSVAELSKSAGVAGSAVIRCCHSLGFSGYSDLKLALAVELSKNTASGYTPYINPEDSSCQMLDKVFAAGVKTLTDTAASIDRESFSKAVELLSNADRIYVYGIGTSAPLVSDLAYRLMQIGCIALSVTDVPSMTISTLNIKTGDAVIAISHSGRTLATVDTLKRARKRGAATIALTSAPKSPITKASDISLVISSDEIRYPIEAISARIAHICIIDSLVTAISAKDYQNAAMRSKQSHELIESTIRIPNERIRGQKK